jgi:heptaprenyl diphosphate synthase
MVHQLWRQFPRIQTELGNLQPYLLKVVNLNNQPIHHKVLQLLKASGKLLRPGFFYIFSEFGQKREPATLRSGAAAIELLHVATLIHDDVIDQSPVRRGVATIHTEYGQKNAIYAGDYLFTCYFTEVLKASQDPKNMQRHVKAMQLILNGELDQMSYNYNPKMTTQDYFHEITGKTAELFRLSFEQGAILTDASEQLVHLGGEIGLRIGQAYQILDDVLDYQGNSAKTRKPVLEDLQSGVYTLPLILANQVTEQLTPILAKKQQLSNQDIEQIQQIVIDVGGVQKALAVADRITREALALIEQLPPQQAKVDLKRLTTLLLSREQ